MKGIEFLDSYKYLWFIFKLIILHFELTDKYILLIQKIHVMSLDADSIVINYSKMAKELSVSRQTLSKQINTLTDKGILQSTNVQFVYNVNKMLFPVSNYFSIKFKP